MEDHLRREEGEGSLKRLGEVVGEEVGVEEQDLLCWVQMEREEGQPWSAGDQRGVEDKNGRTWRVEVDVGRT